MKYIQISVSDVAMVATNRQRREIMRRVKLDDELADIIAALAYPVDPDHADSRPPLRSGGSVMGSLVQPLYVKAVGLANSRFFAVSFTYGYAPTTNKAQGSQWDNIIESSFFRKHRARWLYTALARAAKTVTVVT